MDDTNTRRTTDPTVGVTILRRREAEAAVCIRQSSKLGVCPW